MSYKNNSKLIVKTIFAFDNEIGPAYHPMWAATIKVAE